MEYIFPEPIEKTCPQLDRFLRWWCKYARNGKKGIARKRWTIEQVIQAIGVGVTKIGKFELGKRLWKLTKLFLLNKHLPDLYRNVGRNDPCPCKSGRKYKKCCLQ